MSENEAGPSAVPEERSGDAVLNEVLVNRSALRQVTTTGQPAEVGEERMELHLTTAKLLSHVLRVSGQKKLIIHNYHCV